MNNFNKYQRSDNQTNWEEMYEESFQTPLRRSDNGNNNQKKHSSTSHDYPKAPKATRVRRIVCAVLLMFALVGFYGMGVYLQNLLNSAAKTVNNTYTKSNAKSLRNVSSVIKKGKAFSVLILGTDTGSLGRHDTGRTDTMIIATVNPKTKRVTLTSIPRDLQVKVSGSSDSYDKINSAYTYGGVTGAINTVQNTLHVPIDFYLLVNMGGLKKIVNALGGVTVTPTMTFKYGHANVKKGKTVKLNGAQALDYARMRHSDPLGDYGRQKRQKQVISAIIKKAISTASLTKFKTLLKAIESNMKTNMTYNDMVTIETNYKSAGKTIKSYVLQGSDSMIDGVSYQVASAATKKKVANRIRKELGLSAYTGSFATSFDSTSSTSSSTTSSYSSSTTNSYSSSTTNYYGNSQTSTGTAGY